MTEAQLFIRDRGEGSPLLLFIHGLACDHTDWDGQVRYFEPRYRCITVDLPGHGASPSHGTALGIDRFINDTHAAVASHIPAGGPVVLFGHSMGCRVALGLAAALGDVAAGVVLVDGSHFGDGDPETIRRRVLAKAAATGLEATMHATFDPMFHAASPADLVQRATVRALAMDPVLTPGLLADTAAWDAANIERTVRANRPPLMAIQSTSVDTQRHRVILEPGKDAEFTACLRTWAPETRIELLPGLGHFTMIEGPAQVNSLIESFLQQLARA
jgi:pimeloyl-ACP methyl ester carboxylesterase